jgi:two-component system LytT family response regulator
MKTSTNPDAAHRCPLCGTALLGEHIADTLQRARTLIDRGAAGAVERTILALVAQVRRESAYPERLLTKRDGVSYFVAVRDIDWIEASRNQVRLHVGADVHTLKATTASIEATLNPNEFWRIHRSTIVNVARIKEMQYSRFAELTLADGTRLPIGVRYRRRWREFSRDI